MMISARDLAYDAFLHPTPQPLERLYVEQTGRLSISLKELIAFAENLPQAMLQKMRGGGSQPPPQPARAHKETNPRHPTSVQNLARRANGGQRA